MALEDYLPKPVDQTAPKTLDLSLCRQLISRAPKFAMQPAGDTIREFAEQLGLALAEITGTSTKIANAQNEAMRYQRESETANNEVRVANQALIQAREELAALKPKALPTKDAAQATPKKRGPKAKVVPILGQTEQRAVK